jgi:NAD(P)-dependent dehydrogenase (short-subunit alcohol dehydrogenase family)
MTYSQSNVVVTGVSSGIGAAIAQHLASAGYKVFGSVRNLKDAQPLIDSLGDNFEPLVFDVRDSLSVKVAAEHVQSMLNGAPLSGLVNNAGIAAFGPMECLDDETFESVVAINLHGTRIVTNAFIPLLRADDSTKAGKIINVSSLSGILNTPMNGAYCVAKHALESLGEIYRRELLPDGIDVVAIRSGPVKSEIWTKSKTTPRSYDHLSYQQMSDGATKIMEAAERGAIPARDIAEAIEQVLQGQKTRTAYHFSKGAIASRILAALPSRMTDRIIIRALTKSN